jgi:hypothetical protein
VIFEASQDMNDEVIVHATQMNLISTSLEDSTSKIGKLQLDKCALGFFIGDWRCFFGAFTSLAISWSQVTAFGPLPGHPDLQTSRPL